MAHQAAEVEIDQRRHFPALDQQVNGRPLAYLDSAATTQKPLQVLEAERQFYERDNANVHRAVHTLSRRATDAYDAAREEVRSFIGAERAEEIVFTKGCTEAINLVAASWGRANLAEGDEILLSTMEHHANIVPWQLVAREIGAIVRPIPITDAGELDNGALAQMLGSGRVKLIGAKLVCNALGTVTDISELSVLAHASGALMLVDGAQALAHVPVNVDKLGADFVAFSGHKAYGPTGIGALYARWPLLENMPPYQGGGDMIRSVSFEQTTFAEPPSRFEAGTPNIAGAVGFAAALRFIRGVGLDRLRAHETSLHQAALAILEGTPGTCVYGSARERIGIVSFTMESAHPHDIGTILDSVGVAVRTGHHCCMPLMHRLGVPATARVSIGAYNNMQDLEQLKEGLAAVNRLFG